MRKKKWKILKDSDSNPEKTPKSTDTEAVPVLKERWEDNETVEKNVINIQ